jgi:hypothetical protein
MRRHHPRRGRGLDLHGRLLPREPELPSPRSPWERKEEVTRPKAATKKPPCSVVDAEGRCTALSIAKGMCAKHLMRLKRTGSIDLQPREGELVVRVPFASTDPIVRTRARAQAILAIQRVERET